MMHLFRITFATFLCFCFVSAKGQLICDSIGNLIVYSNYEGGVLDLVIDENIPNIKIGVTSYDATSLNVSGPFANNITGVIFAGFGANGGSCGYNGPVEVNGVNPDLVTIHTQATGSVQSPFLGEEVIPGLPFVNCMVSGGGCSQNNEGGGNSSPQIVQYFLSEFGAGTALRYHWTDYNCWLPNGYTLSDGGNCCLSTPVTPSNPIYTVGGTYDFNLPNSFSLCGGPVQVNLSDYPVLIQPPQYNGYQWSDGQSGPIAVFNSPGTYSFTVNDYCYPLNSFMTDTFEIVSCGPEFILNASETSICSGETIQLEVDILNAQDSVFFFWPQAIGESDDTIILSPSASGYFGVTVEDATGFTVSDSIFINVLPNLPELNLGPDQTICNEEIELDASMDNALSYLWSDGSVNPILNVGTAGTFSVTVTGPCNTVSDEITIDPGEPLDFMLSEDRTICEGATVDLVVNSNSNASYLWNTGETTPTISTSVEGTYTVTITNECDQEEASVLVEVIPAFNDPFEAEYTLCQGKTLILNASQLGSASYEWSNGSEGPSADFTDSGPVTLTITNECFDETYETEIVDALCDCTFYIPNSFTPNGDGINDFLVPIYESCQFIEYSFSVYDRWGALVFESDQPDNEWQGNIDHGDYYAPAGIYVYLLNATVQDIDGELNAINKTGSVTILR